MLFTGLTSSNRLIDGRRPSHGDDGVLRQDGRAHHTVFVPQEAFLNSSLLVFSLNALSTMLFALTLCVVLVRPTSGECASLEMEAQGVPVTLHFMKEDNATQIASHLTHGLGLDRVDMCQSIECATTVLANAIIQVQERQRKVDSGHLVVTAIPKTGSRTLRALLRTSSTLRGGRPMFVNGVDDGSTACPAYIAWSWITAGYEFNIATSFTNHSETMVTNDLGGAMRFCSEGIRAYVASFQESTVYIDHTSFLGPLKDVAYVAVVRDPMKWLRSFFYFHRDSEEPIGLGGCNETRDGGPLTLVDAVRITFAVGSTTPCDIRVANFLSFIETAPQTRVLCGLDPECFENRQGGRRLTLAIDHMINDYSVVGTLDDWALTVRVLESKLPQFFCGIAEYAAESSENTIFETQRGDNASRPSKEENDPEVDRTLRMWLADDLVLYATARALLLQYVNANNL